jgi:hypothetical protein
MHTIVKLVKLIREETGEEMPVESDDDRRNSDLRKELEGQNDLSMIHRRHSVCLMLTSKTEV